MDDAEIDALFERSVEALRAKERATDKEAGSDMISISGPATHGNAAKSARSVAKQSGLHSASAKVRGVPSNLATASKRTKAGIEQQALAPGHVDVRDDAAKASKKAQAKARADTAGAQWFDMPAFTSSRDGSSDGAGGSWTRSGGPTGDELRREVQAIRLRNSLDPKRFYRGGERGMPKYAQLGKIISSRSEPAATMSRADRGKTVVDELVRDAEASAYAKRKFGEQQSRRAANWSSHIKRGNNKSKRRGRA